MTTLFSLVLLLAARTATVAPDFSLPDALGATVRLKELRGEVVMVNFWATHCGPCVKEMPWLAEFHHRYRMKRFRVVGVSLDEGWAEVRKFLAASPVPYPVVLGTEAVADAYQVEAMPQTFVIDRQGRIVWSHTGLIDRAAAEAVIRKYTR